MQKIQFFIYLTPLCLGPIWPLSEFHTLEIIKNYFCSHFVLFPGDFSAKIDLICL